MKIAVFSILAVHVVVLGGLLILGCKRDDKGASTPDTAGTPPPMTNDATTPPPFGQDAVTQTPVDTNLPPVNNVAGGSPTQPSVTQPGTVPPVQPPVVPPVVPPVTPPVTESAATEHKIVSGDNFATLAKKYGVSAKAIQDANPNLVPTRLKIGDVVKIPAKSASAAPSSTGAAAPSNGADVYVVKSGDTLSKIASSHGTTVKELQRLNNLKTTQIKVGDKLKIPQKAAPAPAPAPAAVPGGVPPAQ